MSFWVLLIWAVVLLSLLWLIPLGVIIWQLRTAVFQATELLPAQPEECPPSWQGIFQTAIAQAEESGFQVACHYWVTTGLANGEAVWGVLLQDVDQSCHLTLLADASQPLQQALNLSVYSFYTDGTRLATHNQKSYNLLSCPETTYQLLGFIGLPEVLTAHQQACLKKFQTKTSQQLTPAEFDENFIKISHQEREFLACQGEIVWVNPPITYRFSHKRILKMIFPVWQDVRQRLRQPSIVQPEVEPEVRLAQEVDEFLRRKTAQEKIFKKKTRLFWLVISFAAFAAAYTFEFSPRTLLIFIAVLLFHELGHVVAMWWFGYKNLAILFIPFLGALANARKDQASLTEKVWISLAGPLPGIIVGILIAIWQTMHSPIPMAWLAESSWARTACFFLMGLNLFNLLPIYPLDGGQVINLLLFSQSAYLGLLFQSLGILVLGLLGFHNPVFWAFAFVIVLTFRYSWRIARIRSQLWPKLRVITSDNLNNFAQAVFLHFQNPPYRDWPFEQKYSIANGLWESHQETQAPWLSRLGLTSIYLLSLLLAIMGSLLAVIPNWQFVADLVQGSRFPRAALRSLTRNPHPELQSGVQEQLRIYHEMIQKNPQDPNAYLSRGGVYLMLGNHFAALADIDTAIRLDPQSAQGYSLRAYLHGQAGRHAQAKQDEQYAAQLTWQPRLQAAEQKLKRDTKDIDAYILRAEANGNLGISTQALKDYERALQLQPNNTRVFYSRGTLYLIQKQYSLALADANKILSLEPTQAEGYAFRSQIYQAMGKTQQAEEDYEKASRLEKLETNSE